ncbi:MAG: DNA-directed RNA polymerase subunit beta [Acidobacteria bacterium RIFCSPLOWO2_12_FULL_65_11]|nr:MAG: DNA-directed RNA polymerase subunit beta [Acidobacteria bacterium RIFCSPLOWO2_02_FULL_64_15]OFW29864.1 MAG: DNA-directed RNA polymerase subunit beta [Acidobacteria bacterium RIFCSPLOWO2_12_FULL_65_11]
MYSLPKNVYRERIDFSKIKTTVPIPNLIEIQKKSYERFLQMNRLPNERDDAGLQSVFKSVFPISDFRENSSLEFIEYSIGNWECKCSKLMGLHHLRKPCAHCGATIVADPYGDRDVPCPRCGKPNQAHGDVCDICGNTVGLKLKYDVDECQERGMTYAVPLKVTIRLVVWNKDPETGVKSIRDIKEQEVYFGDIPLMTENGTFIINGTERVIVSQLHRSPGAFFHSEDKTIFVAQIIPYRGSWVEFEYDTKNLLYVRIDRKRKFLATVFLRALGLRGADEIIRAFHNVDELRLKKGTLTWKVADTLVGLRAAKDIVVPGENFTVQQGKKITKNAVEALKKAGVEAVEISDTELEGAYAAADVVDPSTGEVILEANEELTPRVISMAQEKDVDRIEVFFPERDEVGSIIGQTLKKDPIHTHEEALIEIYRRLRPGDPPTLDSSRSLFENMFFNPQKYDFSRVGRLKLNTKLGLNTPLDEKILHPQDFYEVIKYLLKLRKNPANVDDIDHLGNRRVRSVGELLENQFRIGLVRMERAIKEKMSVYQEMATAMPHDLINAKPVMAAIREFFGSSQLSQFMDQTNPLSEITHKRRLSALGPGGLSRERAGFEVRDVHPTHYGRICPIETPEGPNIGLISSLSCYARINEFGFIESPYRKVKDGRVTDFVLVTNAGGSKYKTGEIVEAEELVAEDGRPRRKGVEFTPHSYYLSAWEEDQYIIAQANAAVDANAKLTQERVNARQAGNFILAPRDNVQFIDVSPKQLVSVAASLIPFLENDDANRALMGSNMQRQAVPLLRARAPFVGTGMEYITARDSGAVIVARRSGTIDYVDSQRIVVRVESESETEDKIGKEMGADIYPMTKFKRSNQNTCITQKPIVRVGQRVHKGQVLGDGPCTELGELALGRNVLVAFMPWRGYNFEDAILVSERMVKEDYYTSIHIEEFEIESRDTKLGPEEITRDIPNVSESFLKDLDESGIIRIGANVKPGDILVGKVTPKGETQLTPEEKLLRAIFGEKAGDVRDASLICPPGIEGIIVGVKIFSRKGIEKDDRAKAIEQEELEMMEKNLQDEIRILHDEVKKRVIMMLKGQELRSDLFDEYGREKILKKGTLLTQDILQEMPYDTMVRLKIATDDTRLEDDLSDLEQRTERQVEVIKNLFEEKKEKIRRGDELPPGVIKLVKVYVAMKRKLSVGDKMAGRHGNKGVIARILPEEDMPHLPDGTPVEIVLNPLGVPSRMNVGQILETHLGWAAHALGLYFATPVFDGATEAEIKGWLDRAGLPKSGKTKLYDGMTGEMFEQQVTVGYIYMLKLSHLVDDKIHARSIGPYSLITQQPLGGKAQFGGQRFGEMEVWALEAYGAAHILQELLTAKSDDVIGRAKIYEAIVKGDASFTAGLPESFNVLIRELQSLCLDIELMKTKKKPVEVAPEAVLQEV